MSSRTGHDGEISADELFAVLSDARRLQVLLCLREQRRPITFAELCEAVIERESGSLDGGVDLDDHLVTTTLHHVHLPKLREVGLVRWTDDGMIAYDNAREVVESLLELVEQTDGFDPTPS